MADTFQTITNGNPGFLVGSCKKIPDGGIGPELEPESYDDAALFGMIYSGITENGMPAFSPLGSTKVWQLVNFVNYRKEKH